MPIIYSTNETNNESTNEALDATPSLDDGGQDTKITVCCEENLGVLISSRHVFMILQIDPLPKICNPIIKQSSIFPLALS